MNQTVSPVTSKILAHAGVANSPTLAKNTTNTQSHITNLLTVLANGSGDELFTKNDLRVIGAHPFSESTRRRKIKNGDYPAPIMLSNQMGLWTLRSIRYFLIDPGTYKVRSWQEIKKIKKL